MPLEGMFLEPWCSGPAGVCASAKDCRECNSTRKDEAFERLRNYLWPRKPNFTLCKTFGCY